MNRKEAREFAMQVVFHMEIHKDFAPEALIKFPKYEEMANQKDYVKTVIEKLCENIEAIDETLNANPSLNERKLKIAQEGYKEYKFNPSYGSNANNTSREKFFR